MQLSIVTLFPELFRTFLETSMVGRAVSQGVATVSLVELRSFGLGKHKSVDDTPYGGGSGMVLRVEPIVAALETLPEGTHRILLTPQGAVFDQKKARALAARPSIALVCGRYEGFDERVRTYVDEEISLGDFVMTGGEVAAMAVIEATVRLLPGVLGNEASSASESFSEELSGALEYPQYTRPAEFRGEAVPPVLVSGDHEKIAAWRRATALERTRARRPDLAPRPPPEETSE